MTTYHDVIAALADPTRRQILELLRTGPRAVGSLAADLPVTRVAVSQHLRILREAELVSDTPAGTQRIYRVEPAGLIELQKYLEGFWGEVLASFAREAEKTRRGRPSSKGRKKGGQAR